MKKGIMETIYLIIVGIILISLCVIEARDFNKK